MTITTIKQYKKHGYVMIDVKKNTTVMERVRLRNQNCTLVLDRAYCMHICIRNCFMFRVLALCVLHAWFATHLKYNQFRLSTRMLCYASRCYYTTRSSYARRKHTMHWRNSLAFVGQAKLVRRFDVASCAGYDRQRQRLWFVKIPDLAYHVIGGACWFIQPNTSRWLVLLPEWTGWSEWAR